MEKKLIEKIKKKVTSKNGVISFSGVSLNGVDGEKKLVGLLVHTAEFISPIGTIFIEYKYLPINVLKEIDNLI